MRRVSLILLALALLAPSLHAGAQSGSGIAPSVNAASPDAGRMIDGVAARIEDDIITESEVRELAAFQTLVDGQAKPRAEIIRELGDQWVVSNEASVAHYHQPPQQEVDHAFDQLLARFPSREEFERRCAAAGISETAVRRILAQQLYLSHFIDYRFRPAAQVDQDQIEAYYKNELIPELKARNQQIPELDDVEDTIREILVQRAINLRSTQWLDETRARLKIDVISQGDHE
jgi:hypothetical protein